MALKLIIPPAMEPVSLEKAKKHLRLNHAENDVQIIDLITAAREYCEGIQNRQYVTATWELWLDNWPDKRYIRIPRPPLQIVESIKFFGIDDAEHIMDPSNYFVDDKTEPGRVTTAWGKVWPSIKLRSFNGVAIRFVAGYGTAADVPLKIAQAILLKVGLDFDYHAPADAENLRKSIKNLLRINQVVNI